MSYEKSQKIYARFCQLINLLMDEPDVARLTRELGVSRPTVLRMIKELRRRGYVVQTVHDTWGWRYAILHQNRNPVVRGDLARPILRHQLTKSS
ncbi:MAG: MarR family transcriptional regulator [Dehalococcoidia bacterium]|jgi:DNA-binding IclR family transcriptional regulator